MTDIQFFDGHNDAVQFFAEYRSPGRDFLVRSETGHLDLPRAIEGGMIGGLFALMAKPEHAPEGNVIKTDDGYEVIYPESFPLSAARPQIGRQLSALRAVVERSTAKMRFAATVDEIITARSQGQFSVVLHMEGAEAVDTEFEYLHTLYQAGLRSLGPVWSRPNIFGHGVQFAFPRSPNIGPGLTPLGKELVKVCNNLGIMVDLAHMNEEGFWDVASLSNAPLVATHACAHAISQSTRNLTDRQLDAIRDTDGVIGFNLAVYDIRADARIDANTSLDTVVRHIEYLINRVGEDRVALGSDFDGTTVPNQIKDVSGVPHLFEAMGRAGFGRQTISKFASENWLRVFSLTWK